MSGMPPPPPVRGASARSSSPSVRGRSPDVSPLLSVVTASTSGSADPPEPCASDGLASADASVTASTSGSAAEASGSSAKAGADSSNRARANRNGTCPGLHLLPPNLPDHGEGGRAPAANRPVRRATHLLESGRLRDTWPPGADQAVCPASCATSCSIVGAVAWALGVSPGPLRPLHGRLVPSSSCKGPGFYPSRDGAWPIPGLWRRVGRESIQLGDTRCSSGQPLRCSV